jgi:alkanesulfonate monooxygenase SsuD/methylene tetrahydromethanopterin reductase-like flavin-dependent oxidoreductase (luciferase family)
MTKIVIKYECRTSTVAAAMDFDEIYATALEQIAWVDAQGLPVTINFCVHHGSEDGYLPASLSMAAAAAAVTRHCRLRVNVLLPYHDPVRVAEELAVIDRISKGRVEVLLLGGYVPAEMRMFGVDPRQRGTLMEAGVEALKQAWGGLPFEFDGRPCLVQPTPCQKPHPPLLMGGSAPAAARRAARLGDGFVPGVPAAYPIYAEECERLGKTPQHQGRLACGHLFVAEDADRAWADIAPYALYETNCYARWQASAEQGGIFQAFDDAAALRALGIYQVLTPAQVLAAAAGFEADHQLLLHPLIAGLPQALSWSSLKLFFERVAPRLSVNF